MEEEVQAWDDRKKLHKGALIPKQGHVNWKEKIEKILK